MSDRQMPPSFTPGSNGARPAANGATPVGGRIPRTQHDPVASPPRVRRISSGEVPAAAEAGERTSPTRRSVKRSPALPQPVPPKAPPAPPQPAPAAYPPAARQGANAGAGQPAQYPPRVASGAPVPPAPHAAYPAPSAPVGQPPSTPKVKPDNLLPPPSGRKRWGRWVALSLLILLLIVLAWFVGLMLWANSQINRVDALSGAAPTPGRTFLLAGSDERGTGGIDDGVTGSRTDTIMILHQPVSGPTALISLPRDTFVQIPGRGGNKLNAAHAFGGPPLLVATVEQLTGLTIDHYIEIGFGGIGGVVDAVGGVELCSDLNVNDVMSGMFWTPGCREVDGTEAIAFTRMRYSDPRGDIGRAERQRHLISALTSEIASPATIFNPVRQARTIGAGLDTLLVSEGTSMLDIARMAMAFRAATGEGGVTGTPPISSLNYRPGNIGSTVQLNPNTIDRFWRDLREGDLEPGIVGGWG